MSRCVCGKYRYWSRKAARRALKQFLGRTHERRAGRLHAYRCDHDPAAWHLGHMPPEVSRGRVDRRNVTSLPRESKAPRGEPTP